MVARNVPFPRFWASCQTMSSWPPAVVQVGTSTLATPDFDEIPDTVTVTVPAASLFDTDTLPPESGVTENSPVPPNRLDPPTVA